jgi:AcrR family transcriptional regulator
MADKINRRDEIVRVASELFIQDGYEATSVREIAQQVGCTEAALYYHFKDGKRALLKEVIGIVLPKLFTIIEECRGAASLNELVTLYSDALLKVMTRQAQWFRWLVSEFPNFGEEERMLFYEKKRTIYHNFMELLQPFIADPVEARQTAWIMICTSIGYMQVFYILNLKSVPYTKEIRLIDLLSRALSLDADRTASAP